MFIITKYISLPNFINIAQILTKLWPFKNMQKSEKLCFFTFFSRSFHNNFYECIFSIRCKEQKRCQIIYWNYMLNFREIYWFITEIFRIQDGRHAKCENQQYSLLFGRQWQNRAFLDRSMKFSTDVISTLENQKLNGATKIFHYLGHRSR